MDSQLLSPINDFVFKKIFGDNIPVLTDFLQAVLDLPQEDYKGIVIVDPNLRAERNLTSLAFWISESPQLPASPLMLRYRFVRRTAFAQEFSITQREYIQIDSNQVKAMTA